MKEIRPDYYKNENGKDLITIWIEKYGPEAVYWFSKLNAEKYRERAGKKPGEPAMKDIAKAEFYEKKVKELEKFVD